MIKLVIVMCAFNINTDTADCYKHVMMFRSLTECVRTVKKTIIPHNQRVAKRKKVRVMHWYRCFADKKDSI